MKRRTVLLLGAGFSKPAGGPLLREILAPEFVAGTRADASAMADLSQLLTDGMSSYADYSVEHLFTSIWTEASTGGHIAVDGVEVPADKLLRHLRIHLAHVSAGIKVRRRSRLHSLYCGFIEDEFANASKLDIITFNYDMLTEQLLDDCDIRYDFGRMDALVHMDDRRRRALTRSGADLQLLKLHGSAGWGVCRACRKASGAGQLVFAFDKPYVPKQRQRCPACDDNLLESSIVPPIFGKAGEVQYKQPLWADARAALRKADRVVVVGYSLPGGDLEARSLIQEIGRNEREPEVVVVCGASGASSALAGCVPAGLADTGLRFEDYAAMRAEQRLRA